MKKKVLLALGILTTATIVYLAFNWKALLFQIGGIEQPKIESTKTLATWSTSQNGTYDVLAIASSKDNFYSLQADFGIPGIMIFDHNGTLVVSSKGEGCQITARNRLASLSPTEALSPESGAVSVKQFNDIKTQIIPAEGKWEDYNKQIAAADFIVVYTWAKYFPGQSADMMHAVNEGVAQSSANIVVISTSLDYLDSWMDEAVGEPVGLEIE